MNKRGQFYILAAIIIIFIVSGLVGVFSYAYTKPQPKTVTNLGLDLKKENPKIVDYGIYSQKDLNELLENFTAGEFAPYFLQRTENANVVFVYGNKSGLYAVQYKEEITGSVTANIGTGITWTIIGDYAEIAEIAVNPEDTEVEVEMLGRIYKFELRDNEMFYFLIVHEKQGERYIERN